MLISILVIAAMIVLAAGLAVLFQALVEQVEDRRVRRAALSRTGKSKGWERGRQRDHR